MPLFKSKHTHPLASYTEETLSLIGRTTIKINPDFASVSDNYLDSMGEETFVIDVSDINEGFIGITPANNSVTVYIDDYVIEEASNVGSQLKNKNTVTIVSHGSGIEVELKSYVSNDGFMSGKDKVKYDNLEADFYDWRSYIVDELRNKGIL